MAIREIPRAFIYACDVCGAEHRQENAGGHYTDSRPPYWVGLIFAQHAYDYQGSAVADGTVKRLLCADCAKEAQELVNGWAEEKRAQVKQDNGQFGVGA